MQIGDRVRMKRDFEVEPFFDKGWHLQKDMTETVRYILEESDGLVVDFNLAFRNDGSQGDILLIVPADAVVTA
jgi:hypothetical protein